MSAFTTLKIAVVAPMPNAMVKTAAAVNAGCLRRVLTAYRRSLSSVSISTPHDLLETRPVIRMPVGPGRLLCCDKSQKLCHLKNLLGARIQSEPPRGSGWVHAQSNVGKLHVPTAYPPATAGGTDCAQVRL